MAKIRDLLMFRLALCPLCFACIWALPSCPDIHTWHNVTAFRGTWKAQLASLSEKALFYSPNCTDMGASPTFEVTWKILDIQKCCLPLGTSFLDCLNMGGIWEQFESFNMALAWESNTCIQLSVKVPQECHNSFLNDCLQRSFRFTQCILRSSRWWVANLWPRAVQLLALRSPRATPSTWHTV